MELSITALLREIALRVARGCGLFDWRPARDPHDLLPPRHPRARPLEGERGVIQIRSRKACVGGIAVWLGILALPARAADPAPVVPALGAEPQIDGRLAAAEPWSRAGQVLLESGSRVRYGAHEGRLFVAFAVPIGSEIGLLARVQPQAEGNAPVVLDDAVELWVAADPAGEGGPIDRIAMNALGAAWQGRYQRVGDSWRVEEAWRSKGAWAVRVQDDIWTAEIAVPLEGPATGREFGLRFVERRRRPARAASWPAGAAEPIPNSGLVRVTLGAEAQRSSAPQDAVRTEAARCPAWAEAVEGAVLRIGYFPYPRKLRVRAELGAVPIGTSVRALGVRVTGPSGALVAEAELPAPSGRLAAVEQILTLPELERGAHEVALAIDPGRGCPLLAGPRTTFEHRVFGWEHNRLGEGHEILPPLTPLEVDGRRVRSVGREYTLGPVGLPEGVTSLGQPLLRAPARFEIEVEGQRASPAETLPVEVVQESEGRVSFRAAWSAGRLSGGLSGWIESDGLLRAELVLDGDPDLRVDRLDLVLPLHEPRARLVNAITDGAFHHTLGTLPTGNGRVWDSRQTGRLELPPEFVPYVWLGDEARGLAWLAETTRDWLIAPGPPMQEIVRQPAGVDLVVHFVTRPGRLRRERRIEFALQATPTKPPPEAPRPWRVWQLICAGPAAFFRVCPLGSGRYWGAETAYGNVYPLGHDPFPLEQIAKARRTGWTDRNAVDRWLDRHGIQGDERERMQLGLRYAQVAASHQPDAVVLYLNSHDSAFGPEFAVYTDEWRPMPFGDRDGDDRGAKRWVVNRPAPSWRDFMLFYMDRMLESGAADGFFFDNTYLRASFDTEFGTAWRDEEGHLWAGVDLFDLREFLRRAQTLVWLRRGAWLNLAHMTTTPIAAVHSWAGVSLDGEWKYGLSDYQERFPRAFLRAASLGAQLGTLPVYLPGLKGAAAPERRAFLERSLASTTALHEIRVMARMEGPLERIWGALTEFGYGKEDTQVLRYWDESNGFQVTGGDAEALVLVRGGEALALLVSFGAEADVEIRFDARRLGLPADGSCRDLEGGEVAAAGPACRLRLPQHDFRLIRYRRQARLRPW